MDDLRPTSSFDQQDGTGFPADGGRQTFQSEPFSVFGSSMPEAGRGRRLLRQWWVVLAIVALALLGGAVYLVSVPPTYTSRSLLLIEPATAQLLGTGGLTANPAPVESDHFLNTQCEIITSTPVLALAVSRIGAIDTLSGVSRPVPFLQNVLKAKVGAADDAVHVSAAAANPADANRIVSAVVQAYQSFESDQWDSRAKSAMSILDAGRAERAKEMKSKTRQLAALNPGGGIVSIDPAASSQAVRSLSDALTSAHLETLQAHQAYNDATRAIIGNPSLLKAVSEQEQHAGTVGDPSAQLSRIQAQLSEQQSRLAEASRRYLPNHPIIKAIEQQIDQLTVSAVAVAEQWWDDAQSREEQLRQSLTQARAQDAAQQTLAAKYAQLSAEVDTLKKSGDMLDSRMKQIDVARNTGAMEVTVLQPAEITGPPKPQPVPVMLIAAGVGLILGLGMALIRDGQDDRLCSPLAVQTALRLPVVASIPAITGPRTAADRGQVVHHDPFGAAAESYRTLQTALQFGLPAGTKTILVTSPTTCDGKSTLISNLAIATAQAGRRVLIVDADFRAPMQHRLFGVKDRLGLTTTITEDSELQQSIQRTDIERLSLLPCGPVPTNPTELLNSPALSEIFTDLADQFDVVLIDSPPVTAVTDARILATMCDVSLLVLRADRSTKRLGVQSRDALRSVGAKLVGVAINGVLAGGAFAVTPGYAARPVAIGEPPIVPARPSPRALALAATALKTGPRKRHRA